MLRKIMPIASVFILSMAATDLKAQESAGPTCHACRQQYFEEEMTWAHSFLSGGYIEDVRCDSPGNPNDDGMGCHTAWVDMLCGARHDQCYSEELVTELSKAVQAAMNPQ